MTTHRAKPKPAKKPAAKAGNTPPAKKPRRLVARPRAAVQKRPTEYGTGVVGAVVALIAKALDITDPTVLTSLIVIVGFVPAAITWLVHTIKETR